MFCDSFLAEKMQFLKLLKTINYVTYYHMSPTGNQQT